MQETTLQDYQNVPISSIYLSIVMEKVPRGKMPAITICPVMRIKHSFVRLDKGEVIDSKRFVLAGTRPLSDYYNEGQYSFSEKDGRLFLEFNDYEPYSRYVEYAGKNLEKYMKKITH